LVGRSVGPSVGQSVGRSPVNITRRGEMSIIKYRVNNKSAGLPNSLVRFRVGF